MNRIIFHADYINTLACKETKVIESRDQTHQPSRDPWITPGFDL